MPGAIAKLVAHFVDAGDRQVASRVDSAAATRVEAAIARDAVAKSATDIPPEVIRQGATVGGWNVRLVAGKEPLPYKGGVLPPGHLLLQDGRVISRQDLQRWNITLM